MGKYKAEVFTVNLTTDELKSVLNVLDNVKHKHVRTVVKKLERLKYSSQSLRGPFRFLDLPELPAIHILSYLPVNQVLEFATFSKKCNKLVNSNNLWKSLFVRDFPEITKLKAPKLNVALNWRLLIIILGCR